jgi:hypothetical protein
MFRRKFLSGFAGSVVAGSAKTSGATTALRTASTGTASATLGSQQAPTFSTLDATGSAGGDLSGDFPTPSVVQLSGTAGAVNLPSGVRIRLQQGGTPDAPLFEQPLEFLPLQSGKGSFGFFIEDAYFISTHNTAAHWGYNWDGAVQSEPRLAFSIEQDYEVEPGQHWCEMHVQVQGPNGAGGGRPLTCRYVRGDGSLAVAHTFADGATIPGSWSVVDGTGVTRLQQTTRTLYLDGYYSGAPVAQICHHDAAGYSALAYYDAAGSERSVIGHINGRGRTGIYTASVDVEVMVGPTEMLLVDGAAGGVQLFGATKDFGGGTGVLGITNATTTPSSAPTAGAVIYADSGALKAQTTSATTTTLAASAITCPRCQRDFALEWQNSTTNEHLSICAACLVIALEKIGIAVTIDRQLNS